jgi:hypothetical protein
MNITFHRDRTMTSRKKGVTKMTKNSNLVSVEELEDLSSVLIAYGSKIGYVIEQMGTLKMSEIECSNWTSTAPGAKSHPKRICDVLLLAIAARQSEDHAKAQSLLRDQQSQMKAEKEDRKAQRKAKEE